MLGTVLCVVAQEPGPSVPGPVPPRATLRALEMPLIVDNQLRSELRVHPAANPDDVLLEAVPVLRELEPRLRPELIVRLREAMDAQGYFTVKALREAGLEAMWDERRLEVRVAVPAELRQSTELILSGRQAPAGLETAIRPSLFSAYLNLRGGLDHVQQSSTGADEGLRPFRGDLEAAVNLHNWVVEGVGSYDGASARAWRRGDVRLIRDEPARMIRYSIGDLSYPVAGFQSFQPLGGVTVARNFSLQPYRVTQPSGQTSFFLRSPSKVEVMVNGQRVQTLQLPAGPHNLRDFMFASGGNDVELRITDDVGRLEIVRLSFFFDTRLLAAGEQEFSYSLGFPSRADESSYDYDFEMPTVSLFHRLGLTDSLTLGMNLQGNERQQLFGLEAVWATPWGTFQPDLALSRQQESGWDGAVRVSYRYFDAASDWGSTWNFAVQYQGSHFASLGGGGGGHPVSWEFSGRYSQRLPWRLQGGVGGTYQITRGGQKDRTGLNLFFHKRIGRSSFADLTLERQDPAEGRTEYRAFLSLTLLFPEQRQSFRSSHDTLTDTSRADWQYIARNPVGAFDGNLGVQRSPDDFSVFGGLRHIGYRAEAQLSQDITTPDSSDRKLDSRTSLRWGTALVYADGHLAVSRPVRDSFAIVVPHPALADHTIGVDPVHDSYAARTDWLGPAVIPNLNHYLMRQVIIDAPDLPPGFELGPDRFTVLPSYKSGTVIRVGSGATVLLRGVLLTAGGRPAALQYGEIASLDEPERRPVPLFTNRAGRFSVEGLRPGRYHLILQANPKSVVPVHIPKDKAGIYEVGELRLPESALQSAALLPERTP